MPLCDISASQLVIVDVQRKLVGAVPEEFVRPMIKAAAMLLDAAAILAVPVVCTEQYPQGLGETIQALAARLPDGVERLAKTTFACSGEPAFAVALDGARNQVVLAGMESHVCILQTALALRAQGREVFVVEDAVCARSAFNHRNAMDRLRQAGVVVTNVESVMFEWVADANHEHFRALSTLVKQATVTEGDGNDWRIG